jgi:hypothetical protein
VLVCYSWAIRVVTAAYMRVFVASLYKGFVASLHTVQLSSRGKRHAVNSRYMMWEQAGARQTTRGPACNCSECCAAMCNPHDRGRDGMHRLCLHCTGAHVPTRQQCLLMYIHPTLLGADVPTRLCATPPLTADSTSARDAWLTAAACSLLRGTQAHRALHRRAVMAERLQRAVPCRAVLCTLGSLRPQQLQTLLLLLPAACSLHSCPSVDPPSLCFTCTPSC